MAVELIAECSTNHGGSMALAKEFIDAFAPYVDTVKFQLTRVKHLRHSDPQYEWFQRAQLSLDDFAQLKAHTEQRGRQFLLTVYTAADMWELNELGLTRVKIGSGEAHMPQLVDAAVLGGGVTSVVVSCGLRAHAPVIWPQHINVSYLGCCTRYPAPYGLATAWLCDDAFQGWSDHAIGLNECQAAICCGAQIIETHVQLPNQARPPRAFEKTMEEMRELRAFADESPEQKYIGRWQA